MQEAEQAGCDLYLNGEIGHHVQHEYYAARRAEVREFANNTTMALIGVSHAASEFLVMETKMKTWFIENAGIQAVTIPEKHWWR